MVEMQHKQLDLDFRCPLMIPLCVLAARRLILSGFCLKYLICVNTYATNMGQWSCMWDLTKTTYMQHSYISSDWIYKIIKSNSSQWHKYYYTTRLTRNWPRMKHVPHKLIGKKFGQHWHLPLCLYVKQSHNCRGL
jgi:hypothetical protein